MSYAIVRNEKLTRAKAQGICVHNDRRARNHTNKDIAPERTHLNYYLKKNQLNYVKEFDKLKEKNNLKGMIRSNSIIMCEMVFTSDKKFFDKIGEEETRGYFEECYKFACNYKNLGEQNIVSSVVHLDENVPHMHLIYIPIVHTKDKDGNDIDKVCSRDFWRARDSYRQLQNDFHKYITSKGFELDRGLPVEETGAKHEKIEDLKKITNFENTKKVLDSINLELPEVPDIKDIKIIKLNREKVENEIIKPKDDLINELYQQNLNLHRELSRQANLVKEAEKYQKERNKILADNQELHNTVNDLEKEYKNKKFDLELEYKSKICKLEKENNHLKKVVDKFKDTVQKFIKWIVKKFDITDENELIRDFEKENHTFIDVETQVKLKDKKREYEL
ncbi:MAG TPA: hypothetical protein DEP51_04490 [Clostridiales bacterium]|nr:hypothetical protein [Clostridiales bacterium]